MVAIVGTPLGSIITKSRFCIFEDRAFVGAKLNVGARLLRGLQFYGIPRVGGASGTASWGEGGGCTRTEWSAWELVVEGRCS